LHVLRTEIQAGLDAAGRDRMLLDRLVDIRSAEADDPSGSATDAAYADAFREAGIELASAPPAEAGARIRTRPISVVLALTGALDDWAAIHREKRADAANAARLSEAARAADPDRWRNELRTALNRSDKVARLTALQALAKTANFDELGGTSLQLLGTGLHAAGDGATAEKVLRIAQQRHPGDVWLNYALARALEQLSRREESIRYYTAARAIRPETAHELAHALENLGDFDEAIAVFRDLKRLRPGNARHLVCLGRALKARGLSREADAMLEAAVAAGRDAIRLKPDDAAAHFSLGFALESSGRIDQAIAKYRDTIRLKPDDAIAHYNLGLVLKSSGKSDEAIAEFRTVIRLNPEDFRAYVSLGALLGNPLRNHSAAESEYRAAIRLKPDYAPSHYDLGIALMEQGKRDEAISEYRVAIRLKPDYAEAHCNLGLALQHQGDHAAALEMLRTGHELGSRRPDWRYTSAQWVAQAERELDLANRIPAMLRGEDKPKDNAERLAVARMAHERKQFAFAVRLFAEAVENEPKLSDDRPAMHRYNASCAASLAAAGQSKDEPPPDDGAKAKLRCQALGWLKAELAAWTKLVETGPPQARPGIAQTLERWQHDTDLASVRDSAAIRSLPEMEQIAWRALWNDVDSLLDRARRKP
jgi:tetratricopeptide (TPR) repeat protein